MQPKVSNRCEKSSGRLRATAGLDMWHSAIQEIPDLSNSKTNRSKCRCRNTPKPTTSFFRSSMKPAQSTIWKKASWPTRLRGILGYIDSNNVLMSPLPPIQAQAKAKVLSFAQQPIEAPTMATPQATPPCKECLGSTRKRGSK